MIKSSKSELCTDKIKRGDKYTFEKLCEQMGTVPSSKGKSRDAQMRDIFRYLDMEYDRKAKLWIIKEVYDYPVPELTKKESKYILYIELLLLYQLLAMGTDSCKATKSELFTWLHMVNENYLEFVHGKNKHDRYTARKFIDWENSYWGVIHDRKEFNPNLPNEKLSSIFIGHTNEFLSRVLNRALSSMKARCVIIYEYETVLCKRIYKDDEIYDLIDTPVCKDEYWRECKIIKRVATKDEDLRIASIKERVMSSMGCEKEYQLFSRNMMAEFYQRVNDEMKKEIDEDYFYKQYNIRFTPNTVRHVITGLYRKLSNDVDKEILENGKALNAAILEEMRKPDFFKCGYAKTDKWVNKDTAFYFTDGLESYVDAYPPNKPPRSITIAIACSDTHILGRTWWRKLRQQMAKYGKEE